MSDCFLMGHGGYSLPKLDPNYPKDVTLTSYTNTDAAFQVIIAKNGRPKKYGYKWYFSEDEGKTFKEISSGQDKDALYISGYVGDQQYQVYCEVSNKKGTVRSRVAKMTVSVAQPLFTYMVNGVDQSDNTAYVIKDGWNTDNWKLSFLQSGDLTFINRGTAKAGLDIFLVGGGGGGGGAVLEGTYSYGGGGGGGGYTTTIKKASITTNTYNITIGKGGAGGGPGGRGGYGTSGGNGTTSSFAGNNINYTASGGSGGYGGRRHVDNVSGGAGGSGGGAGGRGSAPDKHNDNRPGGAGGSSGKGGSGSSTYSGGAGSSVSNTCEFEEGKGNPYSGGGAGGVGMGAWWYYGFEGVIDEYITSNGGSYGGGNSDSNATWYGGGGGGGGFEGQGYGGGTSHAGGNGYQGIVIIRNARS